MIEIDTVAYLKSMGVHITKARCMVLHTFHKTKDVLTKGQILSITNEVIDRVTIYRILDLFVCRGIIHIIPSIDGVTRYALINSKNEPGCFKNHLHFICDGCGKTICLDTVAVPLLILPKGYACKETEILIKGTCKNCN